MYYNVPLSSSAFMIAFEWFSSVLSPTHSFISHDRWGYTEMRASTKLNRVKLLLLGSCMSVDVFPPSLVPLEPP